MIRGYGVETSAMGGRMGDEAVGVGDRRWWKRWAGATKKECARERHGRR